MLISTFKSIGSSQNRENVNMLRMHNLKSEKITENIWVTVKSNFPVQVVRELLDFDCVIGIRFNLSKEDNLERLCRMLLEINSYMQQKKIMIDFGGEKQRIQISTDKIEPIIGQKFLFSSRVSNGLHSNGDELCIYVSPEFENYVVNNRKAGDLIYVSDGWQQFRIISIDHGIHCSILTSDTIYNNRGISVKGLYDFLPQNFEKDISKFQYLCECQCKVDYIVLSFCSDSSMIDLVKEKISDFYYGDIIAKIETIKGVQNCSNIAASCDGIMLGRGDLLVELSYDGYNILDAERCVLSSCKLLNKDFIVATRVADSLETESSLSPAEVLLMNYEINSLQIHNYLLSNETTVDYNHSVEHLKKVLETIRFAHANF